MPKISCREARLDKRRAVSNDKQCSCRVDVREYLIALALTEEKRNPVTEMHARQTLDNFMVDLADGVTAKVYS